MIKGIQIVKEDIKVSSFPDVMIVYITYSTNCTADKYFQGSNWIQNYLTRSVVFLYTNDKGTEKEIKDATPFITASNYIKCIPVTISEKCVL